MSRAYSRRGLFRFDPVEHLAHIAGLEDAAAGEYFRRLCVALIERRHGTDLHADMMLNAAECVASTARQNARQRWAKRAPELRPDAEPEPVPVPDDLPPPEQAERPEPKAVAKPETLAESAAKACGAGGEPQAVSRFQMAINHIGADTFRAMLDAVLRDSEGGAWQSVGAMLAARLRAAGAAGFREAR